MKCPACFEANLKSIFREQRLKQPPAGGEVERFYDEDGRKHVHDHTVHTIVMSCSNGHAYQQVLQGRCPCKACAWNEKPTVKAQDLPIGAPAPPVTNSN